MVWDEDKQEYVLTYVNNTTQRSIFDTDFQGCYEPRRRTGSSIIEGDVIDEGALPGPVDGEVRVRISTKKTRVTDMDMRM